jgi:hypothetical protein
MVPSLSDDIYRFDIYDNVICSVEEKGQVCSEGGGGGSGWGELGGEIYQTSKVTKIACLAMLLGLCVALNYVAGLQMQSCRRYKQCLSLI